MVSLSMINCRMKMHSGRCGKSSTGNFQVILQRYRLNQSSAESVLGSWVRSLRYMLGQYCFSERLLVLPFRDLRSVKELSNAIIESRRLKRTPISYLANFR